MHQLRVQKLCSLRLYYSFTWKWRWLGGIDSWQCTSILCKSLRQLEDRSFLSILLIDQILPLGLVLFSHVKIKIKRRNGFMKMHQLIVKTPTQTIEPLQDWNFSSIRLFPSGLSTYENEYERKAVFQEDFRRIKRFSFLLPFVYCFFF